MHALVLASESDDVDSITLARTTLQELEDMQGNDPVRAAKKKFGVGHMMLVSVIVIGT